MLSFAKASLASCFALPHMKAWLWSVCGKEILHPSRKEVIRGREGVRLPHQKGQVLPAGVFELFNNDFEGTEKKSLMGSTEHESSCLMPNQLDYTYSGFAERARGDSTIKNHYKSDAAQKAEVPVPVPEPAPTGPPQEAQSKGKKRKKQVEEEKEESSDGADEWFNSVPKAKRVAGAASASTSSAAGGGSRRPSAGRGAAGSGRGRGGGGGSAAGAGSRGRGAQQDTGAAAGSGPLDANFTNHHSLFLCVYFHLCVYVLAHLGSLSWMLAGFPGDGWPRGPSSHPWGGSSLVSEVPRDPRSARKPRVQLQMAWIGGLAKRRCVRWRRRMSRSIVPRM